MERPDTVQRKPVFAGPVKELITGPRISQPGVPVPDSGREEFNIGIGSPRSGCGNQIGDPGRSRTTGNGTAEMGSWMVKAVIFLASKVVPLLVEIWCCSSVDSTAAAGFGHLIWRLRAQKWPLETVRRLENGALLATEASTNGVTLRPPIIGSTPLPFISGMSSRGRSLAFH
jgi:hypothetical protein